MRILAHRGYWNKNISNNSPSAIRSALERGYGFETDIRDFDGRLVVSHDMANSLSQNVKEVFEWLYEFSDRYTFAINIKSDGLNKKLKYLIDKYNIQNYFTFDMSVPQMIDYKESRIRFFTRQSEVEPEPCMYSDADGVWIDGFWSNDWITEALLNKHIENGKEICLVSPELHKRDNYVLFWDRIKKYNIDLEKIMICTDYPDEANEYLNE